MTQVTKELIQTNPVEAAILTAKKMDTGQDPVAEMEKVDQRIKAITAAKKDLLPIEKTQTAKLDSELTKLRQKKVLLNTQLKNYALLSMDPLTWRTEKGFPKLGLFSLTNNTLKFDVKCSYGWYSSYFQKKITPGLPKALKPYYKDVLDNITKLAKERKKSLTVEYFFDGVIPADVKDAIKEAKPHFKDIFIMAELKEPKITEKKFAPRPTRNADPLVLGWDGENLWLIKAFDTTSLEKYVKNYFSVDDNTEQGQ